MHDTFNHNYCHGYKLTTFVFIVQLQKSSTSSQRTRQSFMVLWSFNKTASLESTGTYYDKCGQHHV